MRGIQIHGAATFIEHENMTIRVSPDGKCEISPVLFMIVEWDLRTEPPYSWDYLSETQIMAMEHGVYEKVLALVAKAHSA